MPNESTVIGPAASSRASLGPFADFPWAVAAQVLALTSLLLPFVGVVVRWISFRSDDRIDVGLSVVSPVPELAYVGFWAVLPAILIGAVFILLFRLLGPDIQTLRSIEGWRAEREATVAHVTRRLNDLRDRSRRLAMRSDAVDEAAGDEVVLQELSAIRAEHAEVDRELDDLAQLVDGMQATDHSVGEALKDFPSSKVLRISARLLPRSLAGPATTHAMSRSLRNLRT